MVNDSIYFINEVKYIYSFNEANSMYFKDEAKSNLYMDEANSIFRIHKSGKGDVERFPLYIDGEYLEGNLRNNGFYVVARPKNVPDSVPGYDRSHDVAYLFTYPNKLQIKSAEKTTSLSCTLTARRYLLIWKQSPLYGFLWKNRHFFLYMVLSTMTSARLQ